MQPEVGDIVLVTSPHFYGECPGFVVGVIRRVNDDPASDVDYINVKVFTNDPTREPVFLTYLKEQDTNSNGWGWRWRERDLLLMRPPMVLEAPTMAELSRLRGDDRNVAIMPGPSTTNPAWNPPVNMSVTNEPPKQNPATTSGSDVVGGYRSRP